MSYIRRRVAPAILIVAGFAATAYFAARAPKQQTVRVVLGDAAPRIMEVTIRYRDAEGDAVREARFTFAAGAAPRVVSHSPRLPNGDYTLEIDMQAGETATTVVRRVTLGEGTLAMDVSRGFVSGTSGTAR